MMKELCLDQQHLLTIMIQAAMVHDPGEAGACLGWGLVDTLPQSLQSEQVSIISW